MSLVTTATQVIIKSRLSKATQKPYYFFEVVKPKMQFLNTRDVKVQQVLASLAETGQPVDIRIIPSDKPDNFFVDSDFII